jgi:GT2 family glycosyltransferase
MDTVDVVVATYGNQELWDDLAERAVASAENQTVRPETILRSHGSSDLSHARNVGAGEAMADWLIFLDADDELDPRYIEFMLKGEGDLRQPSTLGVVDGREDDYPVLIPPHQGGFMVGNHLVIGTMIRRDLFYEVGGFRNLPVLEDWDLWIRLRLHGAQLSTCPEAVYRVHVRSESRNQDIGLHSQVYSQIQSEYQMEWHAKGLL